MISCNLCLVKDNLQLQKLKFRPISHGASICSVLWGICEPGQGSAQYFSYLGSLLVRSLLTLKHQHYSPQDPPTRTSGIGPALVNTICRENGRQEQKQGQFPAGAFISHINATVFLSTLTWHSHSRYSSCQPVPRTHSKADVSCGSYKYHLGSLT